MFLAFDFDMQVSDRYIILNIDKVLSISGCEGAHRSK